MPLTLREARPTDRDAIVDVTLAAYQEYATQVPFWNAYRENILATITNGVTDKGMPNWGQMIGPDKVAKVAAYVISTNGHVTE